MRTVYYIFFLIVPGLPLSAQQPWVLKKDKDSIQVYNRTNQNSKYNDLRVTTTLNGQLSQLAAVLLDIPAYRQWSFHTKQTQVLKLIGPGELYFYSEISSPWPASNRDLIIHLRITQDSPDRTMHVQADETPDYLPEKSGIVRVPFSREYWTVTPLGNDRIAVEYQLQIDPGSAVPAWLINSFATAGPWETFSNLRRQIRLEKYRKQEISFIKN